MFLPHIFLTERLVVEVEVGLADEIIRLRLPDILRRGIIRQDKPAFMILNEKQIRNLVDQRPQQQTLIRARRQEAGLPHGARAKFHENRV
jgi:hypothetical protein